MYSTSTSFISSWWAATRSWQMRSASPSRAMLRCMRAVSSAVALRTTFFSGETRESSGTSRGAMDTSPYSRPRAVSTMTASSSPSSMPQGSK